MDPSIYDVAHVVMAEAGPLCGPLAMVAIAWVYSRNDVMYGKYANVTPNEDALAVARIWDRLPDPTGGAHFAFSREDLKKPSVQKIIKNTGPPTLVIECEGGLALYFFKPRRDFTTLLRRQRPRVPDVLFL